MYQQKSRLNRSTVAAFKSTLIKEDVWHPADRHLKDDLIAIWPRLDSRLPDELVKVRFKVRLINIYKYSLSSTSS